MILCFLLSVNATAAVDNSGLIKGTYKNKLVFYRKNPPPPIVASAKNEAEASGYIEKMKTATDQLTSPMQSGHFSINENKSVDRGQLVIFSTGTGPSIKRYKAFIKDRATIGNVKATDLSYFSNLFDNKDNDKIVKWMPASIAAAATTPTPQPTAEEKQAQIRNLKQEIVAIKQTIQAVRLVSGSQSYVASIQQQQEAASKLNPDTVEQTPEALAAARETLENTKTRIMEMNDRETSRLLEVNRKIQTLISAFQKADYKDPNQTERLVKYVQLLKGRDSDTALAILEIIDRNKKPQTIDNILKAVNQKLNEARYPQLEFDEWGTKYLKETGVFSERNILGSGEKIN